MTKHLSPAAWAVMSAASVAKDHAGCPIAAALRAAAEQVVPARPSLDSCCEHWEQSIRHKLLAIAAELEGATPGSSTR